MSQTIHTEYLDLGPWQVQVTHDTHHLMGSQLVAEKVAAKPPQHALSHHLAAYIDAYLKHQPRSLAIPLSPQGSDYQRRVWQVLTTIQAGDTRTYGDVAKQLNSAAQPIGGACKRNPLAFFIPCHRIVAANGLGGFMGRGPNAEPQDTALMMKAWLLDHEQGFIQ